MTCGFDESPKVSLTVWLGLWLGHLCDVDHMEGVGALCRRVARDVSDKRPASANSLFVPGPNDHGDRRRRRHRHWRPDIHDPFWLAKDAVLRAFSSPGIPPMSRTRTPDVDDGSRSSRPATTCSRHRTGPRNGPRIPGCATRPRRQHRNRSAGDRSRMCSRSRPFRGFPTARGCPPRLRPSAGQCR